MYTREDARRYDMPVGFGPSTLPASSKFGEVEMTQIPFITQREAVRPLVPELYELDERPRLAVTHTVNRDVDYLGGRGYNIVDVTVMVTYRGAEETITGPFHLVLWESDTHPIVLGREGGGYAKVFAEIPDAEEDDGSRCFTCAEYGTTLLSGGVDGLVPVAPEKLAKLRDTMREVLVLGWKYIPGPDGTADVDYPTRLISRRQVDSAQVGEGWLRFETPQWEDAPIASRLLAVLANLPLEPAGPGIVIRGSGELPRAAMKRLSVPEIRSE